MRTEKKRVRAKPFHEHKVASRLGLDRGDLRRGIVAELNSNEILRTPKELALELDFAAKTTSYQAAVTLFNRSLARESQPLSVMTLNDIVARHGAFINQAELAHATEIFRKFGFDDDGNIVDKSRLPEILGDKPPAKISDPDVLSNALRLELGLEPGWVAPSDTFSRQASNELEYLANSVVVTIDGVLTKQQKQYRKTDSGDDNSTSGRSRSFSWPKHELEDSSSDENEEDKRFLSNHCACISVPNYDPLYLTAADLSVLGKKIKAAMLENHLFKERNVIFLVDGAQDLSILIKSYFSFVEHKVILDWHHLAEKIRAGLSCGAVGTAAEKKAFCQRIKDCLWNGDLGGARILLCQCRDYPSDKELEQMPDNEKAALMEQYKIAGILKCKNPKAINRVLTYLTNKENMIACYRLRKAHGLRNSSNSVEKANDLIISYRQKHNGTSWTRFGSTGLGLIRALVLNQREDLWVLKRKVSFKLRAQSDAIGLNVANQEDSYMLAV